jgi:hypothetical protein
MLFPFTERKNITIGQLADATDDDSSTRARLIIYNDPPSTNIDSRITSSGES